MSYGYELIIDMHNCNSSNFTRKNIDNFFEILCKRIDMQRADLHWWDDHDTPEEERQTEPHLKGTSAVQFILTSTIVIHTLDILEKIFINIFSCKEFSEKIVEETCIEFFGGQIKQKLAIERK